MKRPTLSSLIESYVAAARSHGAATESGDSRTGNRNYRTIESAYLSLKEFGDEGVEALRHELGNEDRGVRLWAAYHLLPTHPIQAEAVLTQIAQEQGLVAFNAKMTLDEWRKGRLKFPPFDNPT